MSTIPKVSFRQRAKGCLTVILILLVVYYVAQILLRTPPVTPLQNIAHRGGTKLAPENTLASFRNGIAQGVDYLEFDVQMTKDGVLVVIHDETVDRTTNGTGAVRDLTLEQIRALDAGQGEKVPTFQEVVDLAKASGFKIMPETKSAHLYPGMEEKLLQILEQANYVDQTVIQSFEADSLETLHRINPQAKLCALYGLWKFNVRSPAGDAQYVCPMGEMILLDPWMIRQAHKEGKQVFIWYGALEYSFTLDFARFFGADGLFVNDPMLLK